MVLAGVKPELCQTLSRIAFGRRWGRFAIRFNRRRFRWLFVDGPRGVPDGAELVWEGNVKGVLLIGACHPHCRPRGHPFCFFVPTCHTAANEIQPLHINSKCGSTGAGMDRQHISICETTLSDQGTPVKVPRDLHPFQLVTMG